MMRTRTFHAALLALFVPLAAATSQSAPSRWAAWIGCWEPVSEGAPGRSATCVVPGESADAAELVILSGDSVVQRSTIIADGTTRSIDADGCVGTEVARFSDDGTRVFLSGKVRCDSGPEQETSGLISIAESGHWLDVHGVRVGDQRSLRVRRSRALSDLASVPSSVRSALLARSRGDAAARLGAAMPLTLARIEETVPAVDERVAEAWLLESSRNGSALAPVDAKQLARLEEAGVSDRVIDVVIALGYPKQFQVAITADGSAELSEQERVAGGGALGSTRMYPDVFSYSRYGSPSCYTYSCYLYYSDSPYLYGLSDWNSYGGWGMYPGWGYGGPVTIIVRPSEPGGGGGGGASPGGGRVVKGRGYTPSGGSTGGSEPVKPREPSTDASARNAGSASSSGSATRSSGQAKTGSGSSTKSESKSEPRTARRKP